MTAYCQCNPERCPFAFWHSWASGLLVAASRRAASAGTPLLVSARLAASRSSKVALPSCAISRAIRSADEALSPAAGFGDSEAVREPGMSARQTNSGSSLLNPDMGGPRGPVGRAFVQSTHGRGRRSSKMTRALKIGNLTVRRSSLSGGTPIGRRRLQRSPRPTASSPSRTERNTRPASPPRNPRRLRRAASQGRRFAPQREPRKNRRRRRARTKPLRRADPRTMPAEHSPLMSFR
jgi:hypothetical protein